jgi:hypothetical protein
MRSRPHLLSDLIDIEKIRLTRFFEAFERSCIEVARWSDHGGLTRRQIAQSILPQLPAAFNKGLHELAQSRTGRFGWNASDPTLVFAWSAYFDVLDQGEELERLQMRVDCAARATRIAPPNGIEESGALSLGVQEWDMVLTLALGEGARGRAAEFYECGGLVSLPHSV